MNREDFSDAALVLLGHGTTQNDGSAVPVLQHAAELRRRARFAEVREAFWKQAPQVKGVLAEIKAPRVFIVPLFLSEGYFSEEVIPRELGFSLSDDPASRIMHPPPPGSGATCHASRITHYCLPVGTHASMTNVILSRAAEIIEQFPFPRAPKPKDITLFIAGHGTARNEKSRQSTERQVELIRAQQLYAAVHAIFLEEEPRIAGCYSLAWTRNLIIVPFFLSDGLHTVEDIPVLLGEPERIVKQRLAAGQLTWRNPTERNGKLLWYSRAVGTDPHIVEVILARAQELAGWSTRGG